VERQAVGGTERVVDQPVDVDRTEADAAHPGVAAHVVEVVDRDRAGESAVQQPHPSWDGIGRGGHGSGRAALVRPHEEGHVPWIDGLADGERPRRASPQLGDKRPQLIDDEVLGDLFVIDAEHGQEVLLVAEMAERPVPEIVQQAGEPQGLFDERRRGRCGLDVGALTQKLQVDGVAAFQKSFDGLLAMVAEKCRKLGAA